jgi:hypothetical protein
MLRERWPILALPLQMLLSAALWWPTSGRTFPVLPAFDALDMIPAQAAWVFSTLFCVACVLYATGRLTTSVFLPVVLSLASLLCLLDLNRLQVWLWLWVLLWLADGYDLRTQTTASHLRPWILAGVYVLSGYSKITPWFQVNFDWFCDGLALTRPLVGNTTLAYATGLGEMAIGPLLLVPATRTLGKWAATLLHLYILLLLSPLALHWNSVVWPWNIAMIGLVWQVFSGKNAVWPALRPFPIVILVLVWLMPLLNRKNLWPETMSWKMYANTHREASIVAAGARTSDCMPRIWPMTDQNLLVDDWAYKDLNVPPFNSLANFDKALSVARGLCPMDSLRLEIFEVGGGR